MACFGCCSCCKSNTKVRPFKQPSDSDETLNFDGPLKHRECRDVIFLLIFLLFIAGLGAVTYMAVLQGNPYRLVNGVDSWGNVCNQDNEDIANVSSSGENLIGKSKLFFFDPTYFTSLLPDNPLPSFTEENKTTMICIENCPTEDVDVLDFYNNGAGTNLCRYGTTPYIDNRELCPESNVKAHVSVFNRCIPESIFLMAKTMATSFTSTLGQAYLGENLTQKIVSDLKNTWREIGYLAAIAVGVALIIVILMRFLAAIIVWTLVIAVMVFSLGATTYCWYSWYSLNLEYEALPTNQQTEDRLQNVHTWLIYAGIVTLFTVVILLILLILRNRIALVVQLYKEAGRAIGSLPFLLLQPIWTLMILVIFVAALCLVGVFIETSGLPEVNPVNGHVTYVMEEFWTYLRWYNLFGILWISSFIVACQDMVIAGAVATWYFTRDKKTMGWPILRSVKNLIRYHLGSVAFGSFIIAVVKMARLILGYVQKKLQGRASKVVDFILKCLQFCLWCFERFLKYLNRNAYIEIAIYGFSFCESAKKAFLKIVANALRVAAINSIGDFVLFLGKLSTTAIVMVIGNELFKGRPDDINYIWVPISVACAFAFAIAHCFLLVYEITIDTIFLCFCEDCERNDGQSRPYYMSKNLMRFLDDTEKATAKDQLKNTEKNKAATKV